MASSKKTYDTDSIVLRRIFAFNPDTNGRISANTVLVTGSNGAGSFQDTVGFLSTLGVPTSITNLGQIYNSTILVAGTNITFSSNANEITINGGSGIAATDLTSTTMGLGSLGYLSTTQLISTIDNLGQIYNSTILVAGTNITFSSNANEITINGQAGGGGLAATDLTSTTKGLGSLGYLSTTQLISTIVNLGQIYNSTILVAGTNITFSSNANEITINGQAGGGGLAASDLTSTTKGLGSLGYLSTTQLASTIVNLGQIYNSTILVAGTNITFSSNANEITINGEAGGGGGLSDTDLTSTTMGLGSLGYLSTTQLASTIVNLGQIYNSTILVAGTNITFSSNANEITINGEAGGGGGLSDTDLTSTTMGLGSLGYLSTTQLASTIVNLGQIYNSTILVAGTNITFSSNANEITINGEAGGGGGLSDTDLTSTTKGLGSLGYLSSFATISSLNISSGSVFASFLSSQEITASSITANKFVGDGSLITNVPNSGVTSITAGTGIGVNTTTGAVTVSNTGVLSITQGTGISITGSEGSFTIEATGGTAGTVATADMVSTVIGIQLRATSSLTSSLQGLSYMGYLSSFATISSLNISSGSLFASFISSQKIMASSITANKFIGDGSLLVNVPGTGGLGITDLTSTVRGLGTAGYLSSLTLLSTIDNLGQIYNSTILVAGTNITFSSNINQITINGDSGGIALPTLVSSIEGLGTFQYISSTQLISSIEGLGLMGNLQLTSSIEGLGTFQYISTSQLTSSIEGLGSMRYLSSFNVLSTLNMSSGSVFTSTMSTTETNAGRLNFGELYNNGTKLIDANGNILFSFQTL